MEQAAFNSYMEMNDKYRTKVKNIKYLKFAIQDYPKSEILLFKQKEAVFTQINMVTNSLEEIILPGVVFARTLADT